MSDDPIPVAVVGTGNMGANHVRVYDELPSAKLVEIVEPDPERADDIADEYDVTVHERAKEIHLAEAATVATPNDYHRSTAETLFEKELDVLVEKPLAMSVADAKAIVEAADTADAILQVGHIERFNPAVEAVKEILANEEIIAIEAHRLGPFNEQLSNESVVFDLMIHDLDIIDHIVGSKVSHIDAAGRRSRSSETDHAVVNVQYDNGVLATAISSHVTHGKVRRLDVTTKDAYIQLDYQQQSVEIQRRGVEQLTSFDESSGYRTETITETPFIRTREPLKKELEHFLQCIKKNSEPRVTGKAGRVAVERAQNIVDRIYESAADQKEIRSG